MSELESAWAWLQKFVAWRMDRDGLRWTLKIWATIPGTGVAKMHEYMVNDDPPAIEPGAPPVYGLLDFDLPPSDAPLRLVRLAQSDQTLRGRP